MPTQPSHTRNYWTTDRIMRLIIGVTLTIGIFFLIYYLREALLPFFVACLLAYMLQPLVRLNSRIFHVKNRVFTAIFTVLEVTVILVAITWLTIPSIAGELEHLGSILHDIADGKIRVSPRIEELIVMANNYFDARNIGHTLANMHVEDMLAHGTTILQEGGAVLLHAISWLLMLIYLLFILIDYPAFTNGIKLIVPAKYRKTFMEVTMNVADGMNRYFRGQGIVALCAVVFYVIGFYLAGLPLWFPMAMLVGVLYMIPYFQYVTLIPVALLCAVSALGGGDPFLVGLGKCALVYVFSQSICDYLITPHVMKKELGLNPAIILLSLSVWGILLGIIGMIIALPVTALIMQYYQRYISNRG